MSSNVYDIIAAHIMQKRAEAELHKEASVGAALRGALRSLKGKQFGQAASRLKSGLSPKFKSLGKYDPRKLIGSVSEGKLTQKAMDYNGDIYRQLIGTRTNNRISANKLLAALGLGGAGAYGADALIDSLKATEEA